ncbi:MAG: ribosomal protein S18-alanine N-acetyltransferase [Clostridia bacterium]
MMLEIKPLLPESVQAAHDIEVQSLSVPWSENALLELVSSQTARYFVAYVDDKAVGIGGFYLILDECMITNIAVSGKFRRQKIGTAILNSILDSAALRGCTFATLEVAAKNIAALNLYKTHGFFAVGERKNYYKNADAVLMRKNI